MTWQPMLSAPKDGMVIELLSNNFGRRNAGTTVYRARWAKRAAMWLNWNDLNEELCHARRWRMPADFDQPRQWTDEEEETLAKLHEPEGIRYHPFADFVAR